MDCLLTGSEHHVIGAVIVDRDRSDVDDLMDVDRDLPDRTPETLLGLPVFGEDSLEALKGRFGALGFIGGVGDNRKRRSFFDIALQRGLQPINAVHPTASISRHALLGAGVAVLANAVVGTGAVIGDNTVVNTGATVDHDCEIRADVHIAPGCHISGRVKVSEGSFLGTGTSVIDGITIGNWVTVGGGTAVYRDIPSNTSVVGGPMRYLSESEARSEPSAQS